MRAPDPEFEVGKSHEPTMGVSASVRLVLFPVNLAAVGVQFRLFKERSPISSLTTTSPSEDDFFLFSIWPKPSISVPSKVDPLSFAFRWDGRERRGEHTTTPICEH